MHSLWSTKPQPVRYKLKCTPAVQYTNYGTCGAFELPTQSGTYIYIYVTLSYLRSKEPPRLHFVCIRNVVVLQLGCFDS